MIYTSQRSSLEFGKNGIVHSAHAVFELAGADKIFHSVGYPGWAPNPESRLLEISVRTWKEMFATEEKQGFFLLLKICQISNLYFNCFRNRSKN